MTCVLGDEFGLWTVVSSPWYEQRRRFVRCQCACGKERTLREDSLIRKTNPSRGCANCRSGRPLLLIPNYKRPEYRLWVGMKNRCNNPNDKRHWKDYGGRGIKVCDRWSESFDDFLEDIGPRPGPEYSIERNDVNGDYGPENCRWGTDDEQRRNTRRTLRLDDGTPLCDSVGDGSLSYALITKRLRSGWSLNEAVSRPPARRTKRRLGNGTLLPQYR